MKNHHAYFAFAIVLALAAACHADQLPGLLFVTGAPDSAMVLLDGAAIGKTPIAIDDVSPGPHQLLVYARGYRFQLRGVEVAAGKQATCTVKLKPLAGGAAAVAQAPEVNRLAPLGDISLATEFHYTGTISALVLVDQAGNPAGIALEGSTGYPGLDSLIIGALEKSTFVPAQGRNRKPVPDYIVVPFNFQ